MEIELEGSFQIIGWDESPYQEHEDGCKLTKASVSQSYSGLIEGDASIEYLMAHKADKTATFIGLEKLSATIHGRAGTMYLQHNGVFENGKACSDFTIIAGMGQGQFKDLTGHGRFESGEGGRAIYSMKVQLS